MKDEIDDQINLNSRIGKFNNFTKPKVKEKKEQKIQSNENINKLLERRHKVLNDFDNRMFRIKNEAQRPEIKIITLGNNSEDLLNKIWQIVFSFNREKINNKKYITI